MRRSEFKTLVTIGIIGAIVAASIYGGYIDFTPSTVSATDDEELDTTTTVTIENPYNLPDGMSIDSASYIIFKNGTLTCAKNGETGYTKYFGSDAGNVIESVISACSGGGTIVIKDGTYEIDSTIGLASNIHIYGYGEAILQYTSTTGSMFETEQNFESSLTTLSASASEGDSTISVTSATGLVAGQYIKIVSNDTITDSSYRRGEINQIRSIAGTSLTLVRALDDSYRTTDPSYVRALSLTKNITIEGLGLIGSGTEEDTYCFDGWNIDGMVVSNCHIAEWGNRALFFDDSINVWVDSCTFENNFYTGLGYSISITDCSERMKITDNVFRYYGRHYIATGTTIGIGDMPGGVYRDLLISGNSFESSQTGNEAINNHAGSYGSMTIIGNTFKSCGKGIETANCYAIISNNHFVQNGIAIDVLTNTEGRQVLIEGNQFEQHSGSNKAINVFCENVSINGNTFTDSRVTLGILAFNISIQNNLFQDLASYNQIDVVGNATVHLNAIFISGNSFTSCGETSSQYAIKVNYADNVTVSSNSLHISSRMYFSYCDSSVIMGNQITSPVSHGVELAHSTNIVVANNIVLYGSGRGVSLTSADDADTPVYISANVLIAVTPFYNDTSYTNVVYWEVGS